MPTRDARRIVVAAKRRRGRPPRDPDEWVAAFLQHYKVYGSLDHAAEHAGVSVVTARKYRREHPEMAREIRRARRYFRNGLQIELVKMGRGESKGNVIAILARLKATGRKMAERYSEKAVDARIMNITVNNAVVHPDATAIMERLTGQLGAQEIAAMRGEIVDAEVLALPMAGAERPRDEEPE